MNSKMMMIFQPTLDDLKQMGVNVSEDDFVYMPDDIVVKCSGGAIILYAWIAKADNAELPDKWYAEQMEISMSSLYRYKKELREAGYIN